MNVQEEYFMIPPVTRVYITSYAVVTILVQLDLLSPFQLYFNPYLTFNRFQLWRIVTNFFGPFGFASLFNILFAYRYSRMLEENSFRGRTADLCFLFLFGAACMILVGLFINMVFLGPAFMIMIVYIWSRRNPYIRMNFFGLINFEAPYLPWVLLAFSFLLGNTITVDIMGIAVGHIYFFLEDVFPQQPNGFRILKTPSVLKYIVEGAPVEQQEFVQIPENERPGGMNWGGGEE